MYKRLTVNVFGLAYENVNSVFMAPRFNSAEEISVQRKREDEEREEFVDLVRSLKEDRDWWNVCSALRDRGYHAEVSEALALRGYLI